MKLRPSPKAGRKVTGLFSFYRSDAPTINDPRAGLTVLDVFVIVCVLFVLAAMILPAISRPTRCQKINCTNNLKQTGLAFRIWEGDNNDKYPMQVSTTNGGAMELVALGNPVPVFQVMSNELSTPKIL